DCTGTINGSVRAGHPRRYRRADDRCLREGRARGLVAGAITLLVTLVRLLGEVRGWDPRLFSTEPGGQGAIVGISWLAVPFGFCFGRCLARAGRPRMGRAFLFTLLPIVLLFVAGTWVSKTWPDDIKAMTPVLGFGVPGGALLLLLAWPRAFAANLLYAVLAR